jgi:hypothetical protein
MDVLGITTNTDEFGTPILFESPFGITATIAGTRTKHHLGFNSEGLAVNTKTASITVSEYALNAANYQYRTPAGEISFKNHKVSFADSSGTTHAYMIAEQFPDKTLGLIVCILRDFV